MTTLQIEVTPILQPYGSVSRADAEQPFDSEWAILSIRLVFDRVANLKQEIALENSIRKWSIFIRINSADIFETPLEKTVFHSIYTR